MLLAGGGILAARGRGHGGSGHPPVASARVLALPGCTTATAKAANLTGVATGATALRGGPFGVAVTADGRYSFVTTGNAVAVLRAGSALAPTLVSTINVPGAGKGLALTPDGHFLVVADGSGAVVISVMAAEEGTGGQVIGSLTSPAGSGAVEVLITPDGKFAFVTLQSSARMAHAVAATARAGCGAARALSADNGKVIWVTARQSDALLAFSAARLRSDPKHALIARVMVGETPLGETLVAGGSRIIVADANLHRLTGVPSNLAVISTASALSGRPALLGYKPVGAIPREFAVKPGGGKTILVTVQGAHELDAIDVAGLP
jgi:DNA-binding beta-propeller fold protein YncE